MQSVFFFCVFKKRNPFFFVVESFGIFQKRNTVFFRFFNFFSKKTHFFLKKPQVAVPVLILIGIFRILSGFSSVFDPKTDTKRKLPEKNKTIFFRHFSGFFKKCRKKNGKKRNKNRCEIEKNPDQSL